MADISDELRREWGGKSEPRQQTRQRPRQAGKAREARRWEQEQKTKAPTASQRSSEVAQRWVDQAEAAGYHPPFNANWLAHQISTKVTKDPRMVPYLEEGRHADVQRWLDKMTDKFWDEYVDESISNRDLSSFYLDEAWEDLREYAFISLRAAYLKEHGRRVPPPESSPYYETQVHKQLQEAKVKSWLEENAKSEPLPDRAGQDRKALVRSMREKLRAGRRRRQDAKDGE